MPVFFFKQASHVSRWFSISTVPNDAATNVLAASAYNSLTKPRPSSTSALVQPCKLHDGFRSSASQLRRRAKSHCLIWSERHCSFKLTNICYKLHTCWRHKQHSSLSSRYGEHKYRESSATNISSKQQHRHSTRCCCRWFSGSASARDVTSTRQRSCASKSSTTSRATECVDEAAVHDPLHALAGPRVYHALRAPTPQPSFLRTNRVRLIFRDNASVPCFWCFEVRAKQ